MTIQTLDHLVLTTGNLKKCIHFYQDILGMRHEVSESGQHSFYFGSQKLNIHTRPGEFQPAAQHPSSGTQDFCLIVEEDIGVVRDEIIAEGWPLLTDIVDRTGARGKMKSIYMYDPDGNLVELAQYCREM